MHARDRKGDGSLARHGARARLRLSTLSGSVVGPSPFSVVPTSVVVAVVRIVRKEGNKAGEGEEGLKIVTPPLHHNRNPNSRLDKTLIYRAPVFKDWTD